MAEVGNRHGKIGNHLKHTLKTNSTPALDIDKLTNELKIRLFECATGNIL